jgi:hypothetical protein
LNRAFNDVFAAHNIVRAAKYLRLNAGRHALHALVLQSKMPHAKLTAKAGHCQAFQD